MMRDIMIKEIFGGVCFKRLVSMENFIGSLKKIFRKIIFLIFFFLMQISFLLLFCGNNLLANQHDYRDRYPIVMKKVEKSLDIPLLSGRGKLPSDMYDTIKGFIDRYKQNSTSVIFILIPTPTISSHATQDALKNIRRFIISNGIPTSSLSERSYHADYELDIDTIRLSYFASRPSAGKCGFWPEDILGSSLENSNWSNYGCSYQNNLAAQIVNPTDLFAPRSMTPPDAVHRDRSIHRYQEGGK
ncbi:hypothetical protein C0030_000790 [Candidatus Liberibacter solanacearum]|uniref:Pilus assembly protein CpaD n=1 Tax=Candidatus Liberibacter solanacearum TaxID=556287 RepID=A0A3R7Q4C2_9HYPH|nr:hypothetical protein C0030_000790 [Candidatus Liberibacter solanacearum]